MQYYCQPLKENHLYFKELSTYLVADSFFAKAEVVETVTALGMHFILRLRSATISRLRDDAAMLYINREPGTGKRGAPKKYAGKVITAEPDMNYFKLVFQTCEIKVYNAIVYYKAFNRNINTSTGSVTICPLPSFTTKKEKKKCVNSILHWMASNSFLTTVPGFRSNFCIATPSDIVDWKTVRREVKTNCITISMQRLPL